MKEHCTVQKIIVLSLSLLVRITHGEEAKDLLNLMEENALKKYPWIMNESMDETVYSLDDFRRYGSHPWEKKVVDRPMLHRYWYRNTQTFAFDLNYYVTAGGKFVKVRICHMIITTYLGASQDIRKFFNARYLFADHIDFEIGYMTHEIIAKYQNLIELFYIARKKYFYNRRKHRAPIKYLFNKYMQMLECSSAIIHLCNMFHELKYKYGVGELPSLSVFDDATVEPQAMPIGGLGREDAHLALDGRGSRGKRGNRGNRGGRLGRNGRTTTTRRPIAPAPLWKKKVTSNLKPTMTPHPYPTTIDSIWPLIYGWSIEDWQ